MEIHGSFPHFYGSPWTVPAGAAPRCSSEAKPGQSSGSCAKNAMEAAKLGS